MKKLLVSLLTLVVLATCAFTFVGCNDNVKLGSKITKIKTVIEVYDAAGNVTATTDVYMELYLNFAPASTAHIIKLVNDGFFNGTCVSNVNSNWLEIGAYQYNAEGNFEKKNYTYGTVAGEFLNNGINGNKLTTTKGAIVFKRAYDDNKIETEESRYNTAESTMAVCFSSSAASTFNADSYCILGMICSDDADVDASSDLEKKSSIDKLASFAEYKETKVDDNTVVTYYYETEKAFYTKWTDEAGSVHYATGAEVNTDNEITGKELEQFNKTFSENKNYFLTVPAVKLVIKSMSVCG